MKRSQTLTFCAILFFWCAFTALANNFGYSPRTIVTNVSSFVYALSSLVAGFALWKIKPWAIKAVVIQLFISIVNLLVYFYIYKQSSYIFLVGQIVTSLLLLKPIIKSLKITIENPES